MAAEEFNHFDELIEAMHNAASQIVRKTAFDIQGKAQGLAAVDFGFLKSSIYTMTDQGSTYGNNVVAGKPGATLLPETDEPPANDLEAVVAVGADYGIYQEYGTGFMPAQPYLTPAAEGMRSTFQMAFERLEEMMRGGGDE